MRAETWQRLEALLREWPILRASEGASPEEIEAASNRLGIHFPSDYAEFVHRVGGAMVGPYPIYGLRAAEVMDSHDVVSFTIACRKNCAAPVECLAISVDHGGNPFLLHPSGSVTCSDHDLGGADVIADDFEGFVLYCLGHRRSQ